MFIYNDVLRLDANSPLAGQARKRIKVLRPQLQAGGGTDSMRVLKFLLSGLMVLGLAGCSYYHLGPANGAISGEKSVDIRPFNNQTLQPWLGDAVTPGIARARIQSDGTYRLATSGQGDVILTGVIHGYDRQALSYLNTEYDHAEQFHGQHRGPCDRARTGFRQGDLDKEVKDHTLVHIGDDLASAERQATPLLAEDLSQNNPGELLTEGAW